MPCRSTPSPPREHRQINSRVIIVACALGISGLAATLSILRNLQITKIGPGPLQTKEPGRKVQIIHINKLSLDLLEDNRTIAERLHATTLNLCYLILNGAGCVSLPCLTIRRVRPWSLLQHSHAPSMLAVGKKHISSFSPPIMDSADVTSFTSIANEPGVDIAYRLERIRPLAPGNSGTDVPSVWVVFIGGLLVPMSSWDSVIASVKAKFSNSEPSHTRLDLVCFRYDRYGLGETKDRNSSHKTKPHDLTYSVVELHELLNAVVSQHHAKTPTSSTPQLILVGHSIGVVLARLYMHQYPGTVSALLSVDTNMTNTDFVSVYPDPDSSKFDPARDLPDGTNDSELRALRAITEALFSPKQPNDEGLDRSTVQALIPSASEPKLIAPDGKGPYVTVISNDPEALADEMFRLLQASKGLVSRYLVGSWKEYNEGMLGLTDPARARGIVYAERSGHFVHTDRPDVVADEVESLVTKVLAVQ